MNTLNVSRRRFLKETRTLAGIQLAAASIPFSLSAFVLRSQDQTSPHYTLHIKTSPIEIAFTPSPAGFRFYHTHNRAGANLAAGQYGGEVGPVYIEPAHEPGRYDREVFLLLKEFEPTFSRGGDMAQDFLSPAEPNQELKKI